MLLIETLLYNTKFRICWQSSVVLLIRLTKKQFQWKRLLSISFLKSENITPTSGYQTDKTCIRIDCPLICRDVEPISCLIKLYIYRIIHCRMSRWGKADHESEACSFLSGWFFSHIFTLDMYVRTGVHECHHLIRESNTCCMFT